MQNHHINLSRPIAGSQPDQYSLFPISQDPPPYFLTATPQISLWQSAPPFLTPSRPTTNGHPPGCLCRFSSGQTHLESASHQVETKLFGPLSFDNPPPYPHPFGYSGYSLGIPTGGPPALEIPPLGALPATPPFPAAWADLAEPQVAHPIVHHPLPGTVNAGNEYRRPARDAAHPYLPPPSRNNRKRIPGVPYEADVRKLQERCIRQGAEREAVALIPHIFAKGVHKDALVRLRTGEEVASQSFGEGPGPVYLSFLRAIEDSSAEDEGDQQCATRYTCRLCPGPGDTKFSWKNERDVLRHLRKQHFGLGDACDLCGKRAYTTGEMRSHHCLGLKNFGQ